MFRFWFGARGKLRRGRNAIREGRNTDARRLFVGARNKLSQERKAGNPNLRLEEEALATLLDLDSRSGRTSDALEWCREARSLGMEDDRFYLYPCELHLNSTLPLNSTAAEDLVAWVSRPGTEMDSGLTVEVNRMLRITLHPLRADQAAWVLTLLDRLVGECRMWYWPLVYRAEIARCRGEWKVAAGLLERASEMSAHSCETAQLLWRASHCYYTAAEFDASLRTGRLARAKSAPPTAIHHRLWVRLNDSNEAFDAAVEGLAQHQGDIELLAHVRHHAATAARWKDALQVGEREYARADRSDQRLPALELSCRAAIASHATDRAGAIAGRVVERLERENSVHLERSVSCETPTWLIAFAACWLPPERRASIPPLLSRSPKLQMAMDLIHIILLNDTSASIPANSIEWFRDTVREPSRLGLLWSRQALRAARRIHQGFPQAAMRLLQRCDLAFASDPEFLHTFALLALRILEEPISQDLMRAAVCGVVGAWTALLEHPDWLTHFAGRRYLCYGTARRPPDATALRTRSESMLLAKLEATTSGAGWQPSEVRLLRDLEQEGFTRVADAGGMLLNGDGSRANFGPLFCLALELQEPVRTWLEKFSAIQVRLGVSPAHKNFLVELLGIDLTDEKQDSDDDRRKRELRRFFSPLALAAACLARLRTLEALDYLNNAPRGLLGAIQSDLSAFVPSDHHRTWVEDERRRMRTESCLECSKELVARTPIDLGAVVTLWNEALGCGREADLEHETRSLVGEIAVGRANVLFEQRTKEERLLDKSDRRGTTERRREALDLLEAAWRASRDDRVQASLSEYLNVQAVAIANKSDFAGAADLLVRSLAIKPSARQVAENLVQVVYAQADRMLGGTTDDAGQYILDRVAQVNAVDPTARHPEVQRCVAEMIEAGSAPFFNSAQEAAEIQDWDTATNHMIWAMRIAPHHPTVGQGVLGLSLMLKHQADARSLHASQRLMANAPKPVLALLKSMELFTSLKKKTGVR